jgi:hypothetical protein
MIPRHLEEEISCSPLALVAVVVAVVFVVGTAAVARPGFVQIKAVRTLLNGPPFLAIGL